MKPKEARKLTVTLIIVGFAVMLMGYFHGAFFALGACVSFSALIPNFLFYRCPHCGRYLGRSDGAFCQHCGERLEE